MSLVDEFVAVFEVWAEARPWLQLMVTEQEMELIVAMRGRDCTAGETADLMGISAGQAEDLLRRSYSRCIVDKTVQPSVTTYSAGSFYHRLGHFAKYENWDDIPVEDRRVIDRRFLDEFIAKHRHNIGRKMHGLETENAVPNDADRCWGCGLCANTCPSEAIFMQPLAQGEQESSPR